MIKAMVDGGRVEASAEGTVVQIAADVGKLISALLVNYRRAGRDAEAELFWALMTAAVAHPESPVWEMYDAEGVSACIPRGAVRGKEADDAES